MDDLIDVGFVEKCEPWRLGSRFFPSKVGGIPAWLDLKNVPDSKQLACDYCNEPTTFLCQVYAPFEEDAKAFHRTIYVFICKNVDCSKKSTGNLKILRCQLERINEFYPSDPPTEDENWKPDINVQSFCKTCNVCGIYASSHCSKCKRASYCCKSHQVWDWKNGHKTSCNNAGGHSTQSKFLFPEFELVMEREEYKEDALDDKRELQEYEKLVESGNAGSLSLTENVDDDLLKMANDEKDKAFLKFRKRIRDDPEQVLRFNRGGKPLLISSYNCPQDIPKCEGCGEPRQFEFQIMPQLLHYLKVENTSNEIDWGILIIYTCKNSCAAKSNYKQEYGWKQDISTEILDDSQ